MTESHDPITHLTAADPVRTSPMPYPDTDRMVQRAMNPSTRPRVGAAFRARVASAVLGATLVTGAGIGALQGAAPNLPVLALSNSSTPSTTAGSDSKMAGSMMRPMIQSDFRFEGSSLSNVASTAPVWRVSAPSDLGDFQRIVAALGLKGSIQTTQSEPGSDGTSANGVGSGTVYTVSDPEKGSVTYSVWSDSSLGSWWFSGPMSPTVSSSPSEPPVTTTTVTTSSASKAQYATWANDFMKLLGLSDEYSAPDVYVYEAGDFGAGGASVNYSLILEGLKTNIGLYLSFDAEGNITSAAGALGHFEKVGNYPLIDVSEGIARLQAQSDGGLQGLGSSAAMSSVAPIASTPGRATQIVNVTLQTVDIELQTAQVGGATYLIPYYVYSGTASTPGDEAATWDGIWTAVAVSSDYITIDEPTVMPMAAR